MSRPAPRPHPRPRPRPAPDQSAPGRIGRWTDASTLSPPTWELTRLIVVAAILLVLVATAVRVLVLDRDDGSVGGPAAAAPTEQTADTGAQIADPDLAQVFVSGATSDVAAVTSYDYRTLDDALSAGSDVTTGAYRASYRAALQGELGRTAKRDHIVQSFELLNAAIGTISADGASAKVLMFGTETITSDAGATRSNTVTLTATIQRKGDSLLISALEIGTNAGLPPGTVGLAVAAEAAREEVINVLSYSRDTFAADLARARAGAVDPLLTKLGGTAADTEQAMQTGRYGLTGTVTAVGVETASDDTVQLLVAATGTKVGDDGSRSTLTDGRFEVTAVRVGGSWRVSMIDPVGSA